MKRFRGKERNGLSLCAGDNVGGSGDRALVVIVMMEVEPVIVVTVMTEVVSVAKVLGWCSG